MGKGGFVSGWRGVGQGGGRRKRGVCGKVEAGGSVCGDGDGREGWGGGEVRGWGLDVYWE